VQSLREAPDAPLAGHLGAVCDLATHLPAKLWWAADPATNDKAFIPELLEWLQPDSLLVFDLGSFAFPFFAKLTAAQCWFVTRLRAKTSYTVERVLINRPHVRDRIVHLGKYRSNPSTSSVRLGEVYVGGAWRASLTNVLDPQRLSVVDVVDLYQYRWQIETAFLLVKRLLDLAYLWVGSLNGVHLQVWATWLFYAVLID
jgi:Transposase DDE domain